MAAFVVSYWDVSVAQASGATFLAVVFGQKANVFACRSSTRRPGQLGWTTNRLVLMAVTVELVFALAVVLVAPFADALDQGIPPWQGWVVALLAIPAVLAVDAADKWWRSNRGVRRHETLAPATESYLG
jgi:sterol desaturase/sphingolipid hydroxylase (fatty acid hydroxylase superfamily)